MQAWFLLIYFILDKYNKIINKACCYGNILFYFYLEYMEGSKSFMKYQILAIFKKKIK